MRIIINIREHHDSLFYKILIFFCLQVIQCFVWFVLANWRCRRFPSQQWKIRGHQEVWPPVRKLRHRWGRLQVLLLPHQPVRNSILICFYFLLKSALFQTHLGAEVRARICRLQEQLFQQTRMQQGHLRDHHGWEGWQGTRLFQG